MGYLGSAMRKVTRTFHKWLADLNIVAFKIMSQNKPLFLTNILSVSWVCSNGKQTKTAYLLIFEFWFWQQKPVNQNDKTSARAIVTLLKEASASPKTLSLILGQGGAVLRMEPEALYYVPSQTCFKNLGQGLAKFPRLILNSPSSCLSLLSNWDCRLAPLLLAN